MTYAGVTIGDLYHGNMRFDVNISVAKKGATELGNRTEVKNLNSFRSVERAAEYEFVRQIELVEKGETITQETRGWDEATGRTTSQRSKEDAQDYRYMPDPDIPPIVLTNEEIATMQADVPLIAQ
jgi:aspartyl-tRNA(Asn)/glutamyl-tRNA(Gln) amidotransferase subunit B